MAEQCETAKTANVKEFEVEGQYVDVPTLKLPVIFARYEFLRNVVSSPDKHPTRNIAHDRRELASYAFELMWQQTDGSDIGEASQLDLVAPGVDFMHLITSAVETRVSMAPEVRDLPGIEIAVIESGALVGDVAAAGQVAQAPRLYNRFG